MGLDEFGVSLMDLDRVERVCYRLVFFYWIWTGLDGVGRDWIGLDRVFEVQFR